MGCGASRNDVIPSPKNNSADYAKPTEKSNNAINGTSKPNYTESLNSTSSVRSESSTISANDFYQNNLTGDTEHLKPLDKSLPPLKPPRTIIPKNELENSPKIDKTPKPEPIAFEVPADDDKDDSSASLIKRHPPRRLRKTMEEQQNEGQSLTQETLEEKVQLANDRRTQVLHQRVASARQKSARKVNRIRERPLFDAENPFNEFMETNGGPTIQQR